jgi:hypothetical protein
MKTRVIYRSCSPVAMVQFCAGGDKLGSAVRQRKGGISPGPRIGGRAHRRAEMILVQAALLLGAMLEYLPK